MSAAALSFADVQVRFKTGKDEVRALDGISTAIQPGAVSCIVGPNGAGKTSLLRVAAGLLALDSGTCTVSGRALSDWPRDALARRVAYLPQGGTVDWPLPARAVVSLGRMPHGAALFRLSSIDKEAVERALVRADVVQFAARRVDQLSAGERARVLLARALATEADVLLADEPAAHLDPAHQLRLMMLLRQEARRGVAVLLTLHELSLAARCDRVLVLDRGRLAADGPPSEALSDAVLADVFNVGAVRAHGPDGIAAPVPWKIL